VLAVSFGVCWQGQAVVMLTMLERLIFWPTLTWSIEAFLGHHISFCTDPIPFSEEYLRAFQGYELS